MSRCCGRVQHFCSPNNTVSVLECENSVDVFYCYRGIVQHQFVPEGQEVSKPYLEVLRCVRDVVQRKQVYECCMENSIPVLLQTPYSPNLLPPDFFVPQNKMTGKGRQFLMILDMIFE
jgi:hypothetical protein